MTTRVLGWVAVSSEDQAADDKASIPEQITLIERWCADHNAQLVEMLVLPGFSRSYYSLAQLAKAAKRAGFDAPERLETHLERGDFDVLATYNTDRLGRKSSLASEIILRAVEEAGAVVQSMTEGTINDTNYEPLNAIMSYKASAAVSDLKRRRKLGMRARAERGQRISAKMPFGFMEVADPRYRKPVLSPDPAMRRLLDDLAALMLEGTSYRQLEQTMYDRFGHGRDGRPYVYTFFYRVLSAAATWGHTAMHYRDRKAPNGQRIGAWIWDESEPVPEGVTIFRNTHEPLYTGDQAARLKAELWRRFEASGRRAPQHTHMFAGLLVCAECLYSMGVSTVYGDYRYYRCGTRWANRATRIATCTQGANIRSVEVQAHIHAILEHMLATGDLGAFGGDGARALRERRAGIQAELDTTEKRLRRLVNAVKTVDADNPAWAIYTGEIQALGDQLRGLRRALDDTDRALAQADTADQQLALDEIRAMTLERFWTLPTRTINQLLLRLAGHYRLAVDRDHISHVVVAPERRKRS